MAHRFDIRDGMEVLGSDGARVGVVEDVESGRILLRDEGRGGARAVALSHVERVADGRVHLNESASVARGGLRAAIAEATGDPAPDRPHAPRGRATLLWAIGALVLLASLLIVYLRREDREEELLAAPPQIEPGPVSPVGTGGLLPVQLPNGQQVRLAPDSLALQLRNYLATPNAPAPRRFTFERVHFGPGSNEILASEINAVTDVARVLEAFPAARVRIVGYADARGPAPANADLGLQRAEAVAALIAGRGVARDRIETASGGEGDPAATNATATGQAENRRTELVVTAR